MAAQAGQGAQPGSPSGAQVESKAESAPAETSGREQIAARLEQMSAGAQQQASAADEDVAGDPAKPQGGEAEAKAKGKEPKEPDSIPIKAFKERLARESKKAAALRDEVSSLKLEGAKAREALQIAIAEVERLTGALRGGTKYDERDEQVRAHQIADEARQRAEKVTTAHQKAVAEAAEAARLDVVKEQLAEEISDALSGTDGLVHRSELIAVMRLKENLARSAKEIVDEILSAKLEKAKARIVPAQNPSPSTVRGQRSGGTNGVSYTNDKRGISERIAALRAGSTGH